MITAQEIIDGMESAEKARQVIYDLSMQNKRLDQVLMDIVNECGRGYHTGNSELFHLAYDIRRMALDGLNEDDYDGPAE